jgi:hypothetical protein
METDPFPVLNVLKQSVMSPVLFNFAVEYNIRTLARKYGRYWF